jgi:DNA polymerase III alpha subunit (gram-positive type)
MNCIDNECRHLCVGFVGDYFDNYCALTGREIPDDIDINQCQNYTQAHTCIDCIHAKVTVYETGTIDDIAYRCPFQNNKMIYDDNNPCMGHYTDVPECNINKFQKENN